VRIPRPPHAWSVTPRQAITIQRELAGRVLRHGSAPRARLFAGVDAAYGEGGETCVAAAVLWDRVQDEVLEQHVVTWPVRFPYVPGLLSFRESPAVLAALRRLRREPDVILVDGQGLAHPRRFGIACHIGVLGDRPTVGCAKSILVGQCDEPDPQRGSTSRLCDDDECIGMALRTRDHIRPVYVSIGHRLSLRSAVSWTLACCTHYRLPEPTRLADRLVAEARRRKRQKDG